MNYEQINEVLIRLHAAMESAECHGVLCGLLAVQDENARSQWLAHAVPEVETGDLLAQEALETLEAVYAGTEEQLKSPDFSFQLLLPDDDSALAVRIEALGHWCQGFLMGISLGGIVDPGKLPGELPEFVNDLLEFTHVADFDTDDSQDEHTWSDLIEYVRTGVLLFHEEIRDLKEAVDPGSLH